MHNTISVFLSPGDGIIEMESTGGPTSYGFQVIPEPNAAGVYTEAPVNVYLALGDEPAAAVAHADELISVLVKIRTAAIRKMVGKKPTLVE